MSTRQKDTILVIGIIMAYVFFNNILPLLEKMFNKDHSDLKEKMEALSNPNKINKFDTKKCSKSCCLHTQWKIPHLKHEIPKGYVGSNFMCANGSGGGCLCVTKKDLKYLTERGDNKPPCA